VAKQPLPQGGWDDGTLILVKDLMGVDEDGFNSADLPARVGQVGVGAHQSRPKDDSQVMRIHARDGFVVGYAVQMQGQGAQGGVVGVVEAVDYGVEHVPANNVVIFLCGLWTEVRTCAEPWMKRLRGRNGTSKDRTYSLLL